MMNLNVRLIKSKLSCSSIPKTSIVENRKLRRLRPHIVEECYNLEKMMGNLTNYFDYETCGRKLFMYDYNIGANGNVFRRII